MISIKWVVIGLLGISMTSKSVHVHLLNVSSVNTEVEEAEAPNMGERRLSIEQVRRLAQLSYVLVALGLVIIYSGFFFGRVTSVEDSSEKVYPVLTPARERVVGIGLLCLTCAFILRLVYSLVKP